MVMTLQSILQPASAWRISTTCPISAARRIPQPRFRRRWPECLQGLTHLRTLNLSFNHGVTDAKLASLASLTELEELDLAGTHNIGGPGIVSLQGLTKLRKLDLSGNLIHYHNHKIITDASMKPLEALVNLEELDLCCGAGIADADLEYIRGLTKLRKLDLSTANVTDRGLRNLGKLTELRDLDLGETKTADAGVEELLGLHQLTKLRLEGTLITDGALKHLAQMKQLKELNISYTELEQRAVNELIAALPECSIEFQPKVPLPPDDPDAPVLRTHSAKTLNCGQAEFCLQKAVFR